MGAQKDLFNKITANIDLTVPENVEVRSSENNIFTLYADNSVGESYPVTFSITPEVSGEIVLFTNQPIYVGYTDAGETISVTISMYSTKNNRDNIFCYCCSFDKEAYDNLLNTIKTSVVTPTDYSLSSLEFQVNVPTSSYLFTPFSYKSPYKLDSSNLASKITQGLAGRQAILLSEGKNTVRLHRYLIANIIGIILSLISITVFILIQLPSTQLMHLIDSSKEIIAFPIKKLHKVIIFFHKYKIAFGSVLLPFFILILASIIAGFAPFGTNIFFKTDGAGLTVPTLFMEQTSLSNGELLFNQMVGGGINLFSNFPLLFMQIWLLFIKPENMIAANTIIQIFRISLCGFSIYYYLTHRLRGHVFAIYDYRILPLSCAYALSAYALNFRFFLGWHEMLFALPILIVLMDKMMFEKKYLLYTFLLAFCIITNVMNTMYLCIFLFFWFFSYSFKNFKDFITKGIRFGLASILSASMSYLFLYLIVSSRSAGAYQAEDSVFPAIFGFYQNYCLSLRQLFLLPTPISVTEANGAINLYFSVLLLIPIICSLFLVKKDRRRITELILVIFIFYSSNNDFFSYLWNGLHYQSLVPNRYSFLLVFLLLDIAADGILSIRKIKVKHLTASFITAILLLLISAIPAPIQMSPIAMFSSAALISLAYLLLLYSIKNPKKLSSIQIIFSVLICLEIAFSTCTTFLAENKDDGVTILANAEPTQMLKNLWLGDDITTRVNYLFVAPMNQNMVNQVNSLNQFNSYVTAEQCNYADSLGIYSSSNIIVPFTSSNPFVNALTNTRYLILRTHTATNANDYDNYKVIGHKLFNTFLENEYTLSPGFYVPDSLLKKAANTSNIFDLGNMIVAPYNLSTPIYTDIIEPTSVDHNTFIKKQNTHDNIYSTSADPTDDGIYFVDLNFTPTTDGTYYYRSYDYYYLGRLKSGNTYTYHLRTHSEDPGKIVRFDFDAFKTFYENAKSQTINITDSTLSSLTGTVNFNDSGYLMMDMPYAEGWEAYVDGQKTDIQKFVNSAMLIQCPGGSHSIHLEFRPRNILLPVTVTIISWLFFLGLIIFSNRKGKEENV